LTLPTSADGLAPQVLIGLNGNETALLLAAGQPIPAPVSARALVDSGTNVTCVASRILQQLGLAPAQQHQTQTVAGSLFVNLFDVSFNVQNPNATQGPVLVLPQLRVMEMIQQIPDVEVLIGLDVLQQCLLVLDGPHGHFALAD
jgi:hypothetical protein